MNNYLKKISKLYYIFRMKKHLALNGKFLNVSGRFVSADAPHRVVPYVKVSSTINELMGGLIISENNVLKGGKIKKSKPIRFLI